MSDEGVGRVLMNFMEAGWSLRARNAFAHRFEAYYLRMAARKAVACLEVVEAQGASVPASHGDSGGTVLEDVSESGPCVSDIFFRLST